MMLLPIHIIGGVIGIVAGTVALYAAKGATLHRKSGKIFVYAMLVMSATGAVIASLHPNWATALQGVLTFYLVTTGLLTVAPRSAGSHWMDVAAMLVAVTVGLMHVAFGLEASLSATGTKFGYPPLLYFIFGPLALLAAFGDFRMIRGGGLDRFRRIRRHLWRMCFPMFIATASFFLGQAKVIPQPLRIYPVLTVLALLPLVLMFYWLWRMRRKRQKSVALLYATHVSA